MSGGPKKLPESCVLLRNLTMEKLGLYSTEPVHIIVGQESGLTHHQWSWLQHTICTLGQVQQPLGFLSPAHKTKMWAVSKLGFRSVSNLHCQHYTQAGNIFSYSCEKSGKFVWLGLLSPAILSTFQLSSLYSVWDTKLWIVRELAIRSGSNLHWQWYTQAGNIFSQCCEKSGKKIWLGLLPPAILRRIQLSPLYSEWDTKLWIVRELGIRSVSNLDWHASTLAGNIFSHTCVGKWKILSTGVSVTTN